MSSFSYNITRLKGTSHNTKSSFISKYCQHFSKNTRLCQLKFHSYIELRLIITLAKKVRLRYYPFKHQNRLLKMLFLITFIILTITVLFLGILSMASGKKFTKKHGTKLMSLRVLLQGAAIISLVFLYLFNAS